LSLFLVLANGTDSLTWYIDDVQKEFPSLSSIDDDHAEELLEEHSNSIFANARSICTVNEDTSLETMVYEFAALSDLDVSEVTQRAQKNGLTRISFNVDGLGQRHFELESRKRPDITPALAEMNLIAKIKHRGQYLLVPEGNSESETFIFADEGTLAKLAGLLKIEFAGASRTSED